LGGANVGDVLSRSAAKFTTNSRKSSIVGIKWAIVVVKYLSILKNLRTVNV